MKRFGHVNGKIVDINKPAVQINDLGILRGYGVFDFLRTYNGKIFHWDDHFARFTNSAKMLNLKIPAGKKAIQKSIYDLIKKNRCTKQDVSIWLVITGGPSEDSMTYKKPTFSILLHDIFEYPKNYYEKGIKVLTYNFQRSFFEAKTNSYIEAVSRQEIEKKKGAFESLYVRDGKISEASRANFFIFKGATLITAKDSILKGITRKIVLKLAKKRFKVEERDVKLSDLDSATEAFVTGTNKSIMPVTNVDGKKIGDGLVGENTKLLMSEYKTLTEKN